MVRLLDVLAAWNIQFEVLFEDRLQPENLRRYSLIVVPYPDHMPDGAREGLAVHGQAGGAIIAP